MQLLTMKRGHQEDDSNGNNAPHLGIPRHHGNASSAPSQQLLYQHQHQLHVSPDIKPPLPPPLPPDSLQHASSDHQHLQTEEKEDAGSSFLQPPSSLVSTQMQGSLSRPGQLFPSGDTPATSSEECGDSFCHLASSTVDSDSSSSPDINSNTLLVGFGDTGLLRRDDAGNPSDPRISEAGSSDQKMLKDVQSSKMVSEEKGVEEEIASQSLMMERNPVSRQEDVCSVFDASSLVENLSADSCQGYSERVEGFRPAQHPQSPERVQSHSAFIRRGIHGSGQLSRREIPGVTGQSSSTTLSSDVSFRQSVDMDVDSEYIVDPSLESDTLEIPSSCFTPLQAGPVRGSSSSGQCVDTVSPPHQSVDTLVSHSQHTGLGSDPPAVGEASIREEDRDINRNVQHGSSQGGSFTPQAAASSSSPSSDRTDNAIHSDRLSETDAVISHHESQPDSDADKHLTLSFAESFTSTALSLPDVLLGSEPQTDSGGSVFSNNRQSQHSSLTSPLLQNGQRVDPSNFEEEEVVRNGAVEEEEEEEEQEEEELSWSGDVPLSGDRQDLPDPVASLLSDGDHRHFIPIGEECTQNHPSGTPDSGDPASNHPG